MGSNWDFLDLSDEGSSDKVICLVAVLGALTKKLPRDDNCFNGDWGFVTDLSRSVHGNGSGKPCGMQSSSPNQGWVSITKPSMGQRKDQVVDWRINSNGEDGTNYSTNDRISLLTPVEGLTVRDLKAKGKVVLGVDFLETQF